MTKLHKSPSRRRLILSLSFSLVVVGATLASGAFDRLRGFRPPAPQECSVRPDPTTKSGCLTPRTAVLAKRLKQRRLAVSCWDKHEWSPGSDHPKGRACDVFPGRGGVRPTAAQKSAGDALAAELRASAPKNNVKYLIWSGKIWSVARNGEGWRPYNGGGTYDPKSIIGGHYDHIHISVY